MTDAARPLGAAPDRDLSDSLAPGKVAERQIDQFIERRCRGEAELPGERTTEDLWEKADRRRRAREADDVRLRKTTTRPSNAGRTPWQTSTAPATRRRSATGMSTYNPYRRRLEPIDRRRRDA